MAASCSSVCADIQYSGNLTPEGATPPGDVRKRKHNSYTIETKLQAVAFAEKNSKEAAARRFKVDPKRIRDWCKQKNHLQATKDGDSVKRRRLCGGGRKPHSEDLEELLVQWLEDERSEHRRVSRRMLQNKALALYNSGDFGGVSFVASRGWLQNFLERNGISLCKKTTQGQKLPHMVVDMLEKFILYVRHLRIRHQYQDSSIIAMDEMTVWLDMAPDTTLDKTGATSVPILTTGHEKTRITVVLAATANGAKLPPFLVFKGERRDKEVDAMSGVVAAYTHNGWMNQELTLEWLSHVVGSMAFGRRLLVWDSYHCHISKDTKAQAKKLKLDMAVIPGGCTGIIQAPDVCWNKPFKTRLRAMYDHWMATRAKQHTHGGNLKAPSRSIVASWVKGAWEGLPAEMVSKSFKVCAVTTALDSSEDDLTFCLKPDGILHERRESLAGHAAALLASKGDLSALDGLEFSVIAEPDIEEDFANELAVEDDEVEAFM